MCATPKRQRRSLLIVALVPSVAAVALLVSDARSQQQRGALPRRRPAALAPPPKFDQQTLDAFFPNALEKLGPKPEAPAQLAPSTPMPGSGPDAGGIKWSEFVSAETIEDEIKQLAPQVNEHVKSLAHFRASGYQQARRDLTELALLFGVAGEFDQPVRWQEQGAALRVAFGRAGLNCKAGSEATYREAKARAQDLNDLVRGGRPAIPTTEAIDWTESIDRGALMSRMEAGYEDKLSAWLSNERDFASQREGIEREARLLAAMARLIQQPGYEYADDSGYQGYASALEKACRELVERTRDDDYRGASQALSHARENCEKCHADFRG